MKYHKSVAIVNSNVHGKDTATKSISMFDRRLNRCSGKYLLNGIRLGAEYRYHKYFNATICHDTSL